MLALRGFGLRAVTIARLVLSGVLSGWARLGGTATFGPRRASPLLPDGGRSVTGL